LSFIVSALLVESLYLTARSFPSTWWFLASIGWFVFSVVLTKIFPVLIIPIFYQSRKIDDCPLRQSIKDMTNRANIKLDDVFEINLSKNTKKSNAALVGWGDTRRVLLADNLVREFTSDEILVVVGHELAHYKHRHIWKLVTASFILTVISFGILYISAPYTASILRAGNIYDIAIFPALSFIFLLINIVLQPFINGYSRMLEREADLYALKLTGLKDAFISLMDKFSIKNLSDTNPPRIIEIMLYDHPPISKRIEMARHFNPAKKHK